MGLFDFPVSNADDDAASGGLLNLAQPVSGVLAPPQAGVTPVQQKWLAALGVLSAAMKDAGAFMQHQPEAANNVANFLRQRNAAASADPAPVILPQNLLATALLNAAQYRRPFQTPSPPMTPQPVNNAPAGAIANTAGQVPPAIAAANANPAGQPPQGVDPLIWQHMTPQERALWQI